MTNSYDVVLGETDRDRDIDPPQVFRIAKVTSHKNYNKKMHNDIAIIKLDRKARITGIKLCFYSIIMCISCMADVLCDYRFCGADLLTVWRNIGKKS